MTSFHLYSSVFTAQLSMLITATCIAWSSPMLPKLSGLDDNPLGRRITTKENSLLAALAFVGSCFGSVIYGALASYFGKKPLLISLGFVFFASYFVMAFGKDILVLFLCRFSLGIGLGGSFNIVSIYTGELADESNRGFFGTCISVFLNIGFLFPYSLGPFLSFFWFHISLAILPAVFIVLLILFSYESPRYLIQSDPAKAESILKKLRNREDVIKELNEMRKDMEDQGQVNLIVILKSRGLRRAFIIALGGYSFFELTGISVLFAYSQSIFESAGSNLSPAICSIIVGFSQVFPPILTSFIAEKYPRKSIWMLSHLLVSFTQIVVGLYFHMKIIGVDVGRFSSIPLISLILFVMFLKFGAEPILLTFLGELFPTRVKGPVLSFILLFSCILSAVLVSQYNTLRVDLGMDYLFWFFATCSFLGVIFVRFIVIETKGKTLQEIQEELNIHV